VLLHHHVGRPADDEKMFHVVAANKDETTPAVDRCLVDHGEPRLTAARCAAAEPSAAEPSQQPERQPDQDEHHHHEQKGHEAALSFAEQGVQHHSSLRPRGVACRSGSPEWLTPLAMPVAVNTNKKLRKIGPRMPNSMPQSFLVVNGALMARAGMARAGMARAGMARAGHEPPATGR